MSRIDVDIRWLIRRDMPEVLKIEGQSFDSPWTDEDFMCCLRQRNCIGMVAEHERRLVGYMVYELHRSKLLLLNLAVHPTYRRLSVARQMIERLIDKLSLQRRSEIWTEVSEKSLAGQLFFKSLRFRCVSVSRDHYEDSDASAYVMRYRVRPTEIADDSPFHPRNRISEYIN